MTNKNTGFLRRYRGLPNERKFSGWMLMHPEQMMKLFGMPLSAVIKEEHGGAMAKRFSRIADGQGSLRLIKKTFSDLKLNSVRVPTSYLTSHLDVEGAHEAHCWRLFLIGLEGEQKLQFSFLIDVETASELVFVAYCKGNYLAALESLKQDPLLNLFVDQAEVDACLMNPQLIKLLKKKMYLEMQLSYIALLDVLHSLEGVSQYDQLLPGIHKPSSNVASSLFQFIIDESSLSSDVSYKQLADILHRLDSSDYFDERTIRRWRLGEVLLSAASLRGICQSLFDDTPPIKVFNHFGAAVLINDLLEVAEHFQSEFSEFSHTSGNFTSFPFCCNDVIEWCDLRYPFWLTYFQERGMSAKQANIPWLK